MGDHADLPTPCNSKLFKDSSNYRSGFSNPWINEIHHIVCEHAILDIKVSDPSMLKFVKDCLCKTTWDINKKDNLIQLPLKDTYMESDGQTPEYLCAHNCDHNIKAGYTNEVKGWLQENIWDTCVDKKKSHATNAKAIEGELGTCIDFFTSELERRGHRSLGTKMAWENRFGDGWETDWYMPFSMADDPFVTPRLPVRRWPKCVRLLLGV